MVGDMEITRHPNYGRGLKHSSTLRAKALDLVDNHGVTPAAAARECGVPEGTVRGWLQNRLPTGKPRDWEEENRAVVERDRDYNANREFYDDIHVQVLGDPPLHRSALWKKLEKEGRL